MLSYRLQPSIASDVNRIGSVSLWLAFRCLPALVLATLSLLLLLSGTARAGQEPAFDEPAGPQLVLQSAPGVSRPAVMQRSKVHFAVSGMIATVTLEQSFSNPGDQWVEGVYSFPLPDGAAVRYLEMQVGERRIIGKVRERSIAKKVYEQARAAGKKASLVEQQRPNLFTNRVANIGPGEDVTVKLEYVQQAAFDRGQFSLRFPMTITPRYMPGEILAGPEHAGEPDSPLRLNPLLGWALPTDQVPDADAISPVQHAQPGSDHQPLNPIEITARVDAGMPLAGVASPYHEIALVRRAGVYDIQLAGGNSEMDRDFVLNWRPVTGSAPTAAFFSEKVIDQHYGLLMLLPPGCNLQCRPCRGRLYL